MGKTKPAVPNNQPKTHEDRSCLFYKDLIQADEDPRFVTKFQILTEDRLPFDYIVNKDGECITDSDSSGLQLADESKYIHILEEHIPGDLGRFHGIPEPILNGKRIKFVEPAKGSRGIDGEDLHIGSFGDWKCVRCGHITSLPITNKLIKPFECTNEDCGRKGPFKPQFPEDLIKPIWKLPLSPIEATGAEIYSEIYNYCKSQLILEDDDYHILTIWIMASWLVDDFQTCPYLCMLAPKESGKSISGEELMLTSMALSGQNKINLKTVKEVIDSELSKGCSLVGDSEISYNNTNRIKILQLNKHYKLEWVEPKAFIRHRSPKQLIEVETRSGRIVVATHDHSFIKFVDGELIPVKGSELVVGDVMLTVKNLPKVNEEREYKNIILSKELGYIAGIYLAEGSSGYEISNHNQKIIKYIQICCETLHIKYTTDPKRGCIRLSYKDKTIKNFLLEFYWDKTANEQYKKQGAGKKTIPDFVFNAPDEFVKAFIAGYIDGDGYVIEAGKRGRVASVEASSTSYELITKLSVLLSRFGIACKLRNKNVHGKPHTLLIISANSLVIFRELIAEYMQENNKKNKILKVNPQTHSITETIKGIGQLIAKIEKKVHTNFGMSGYSFYAKREGSASIQNLTSLITSLEDYESKTCLKDEIRLLKTLVNSDVVFDKIKKISEKKSNVEFVYDFSTPEENFVANGMVVHNTQVLDVISELGYRATKTISVTAPSLFRAIELWHVTLLIDEAEYQLKQETEAGQALYGCLNGGYKRGSYALRTEGDSSNRIPTAYDVFGFKAIATTQLFHPTLESRSIIINMSQGMPDKILIDTKQAMIIRAKLLFWRFETLTKLQIVIPESNKGRLIEMFIPLFTVAQVLKKKTGRKLTITYPELINILQNKITAMESTRKEEEHGSSDAQIINAINNISGKPSKGINNERETITLREIAEELKWIDPYTEQKEVTKILANIGRKLKIMGLKTRHTMHGSIFEHLTEQNEPKLKELYKRFIDMRVNEG